MKMDIRLCDCHSYRAWIGGLLRPLENLTKGFKIEAFFFISNAYLTDKWVFIVILK